MLAALYWDRVLSTSRAQILSPAFTVSPASTKTAVHLAAEATMMLVSPSATTLPDTRFSTEMSSAATVIT